mmetsp:Transcript_24080/g.60291  ORF Transcript_24080/g.60291 Transcript_24080/m.60291 type:complete len:280 (+) Transcript_24080:215-1054(+)
MMSPTSMSSSVSLRALNGYLARACGTTTGQGGATAGGGGSAVTGGDLESGVDVTGARGCRDEAVPTEAVEIGRGEEVAGTKTGGCMTRGAGTKVGGCMRAAGVDASPGAMCVDGAGWLLGESKKLGGALVIDTGRVSGDTERTIGMAVWAAALLAVAVEGGAAGGSTLKGGGSCEDDGGETSAAELCDEGGPAIGGGRLAIGGGNAPARKVGAELKADDNGAACGAAAAANDSCLMSGCGCECAMPFAGGLTESAGEACRARVGVLGPEDTGEVASGLS